MLRTRGVSCSHRSNSAIVCRVTLWPFKPPRVRGGVHESRSLTASSTACHLLEFDSTLPHAIAIFRGLQVAPGLHFTRRFRHLRVARANHFATK